jgi:hypothetical protein
VRCGFRPGSTPDGHGTPASLVAVVYPLLEGRSLGWPGWIWLLLAAGLAGLAALAWVEARRQHGRVAPLMQPQLFRIPRSAPAWWCSCCSGSACRASS